jgi:hypothetical protein
MKNMTGHRKGTLATRIFQGLFQQSGWMIKSQISTLGFYRQLQRARCQPLLDLDATHRDYHTWKITPGRRNILFNRVCTSFCTMLIYSDCMHHGLNKLEMRTLSTWNYLICAVHIIRTIGSLSKLSEKRRPSFTWPACPCPHPIQHLWLEQCLPVTGNPPNLIQSTQATTGFLGSGRLQTWENLDNEEPWSATTDRNLECGVYALQVTKLFLGRIFPPGSQDMKMIRFTMIRSYQK